MDALEASNKIEAALNEVIKEHEDARNGDVLMDWILIAQISNPDPEAGTGYPMFVANNDMAIHRVVGLLDIALRTYGPDSQ